METRNWLPAIDCPSDKMGGFPLSNATLLEEKTKNIPEHVFIDWTIHETTSPVSLFFSSSSIFFFSVRPSAVDSSGEEQQSEPRAKTDRYERTPSTYQGYWSGPLLTIATTQAIDNSRVWKIGCLTTTAIDASADLVAMGPVIWRQAQKAKKYININMLCWTYACHGDDFVVDKLWR